MIWLLTWVVLPGPLWPAAALAAPVIEPAAEQYVVEAVAGNRAEARRWRRLARGLGHDPALVLVRRLDGSESYAVRISNLSGAGVAQDVAAALRAAAETTAALAPFAAAVEVYCDDCTDFAEVKRQVAALAEDFRTAPSALEAAEAVTFRFTLTDPERVAEHLYARRGADRFLSVALQSGQGVSSQTRIAGSSATMVVDGAPPEAIEPDAARVVVDEFAPEAILAFPLGVSNWLADVDVVRAEHIEGCLWVTLGDPVLTALALRRDGSPCGAALADGAGVVVLEFGTWSAVGGLPVPGRIRRTRDGREADLSGLSVQLDPVWEPGWSEVPPAP